MNSDFKEHYKVIKFGYDKNNYSDLENKEIENLLKYKKGCQFLFCGEDTIALSRQRFIILAKPNVKPLIYLIYEGGESQVKFKALFSRCITEVDGLRYLTNEGVFLINKVPKELYNICHPFSHSPSKKLIQIYKNYLLRKYNSDKDIRSLNNVLSSAIENLQNASANLFWTETNNKDFKKEIQFFILKAAQYAKKFVNKQDFNYDKFNEICKEMRIVNNLRNHKKYPVFITFLEYMNANPKEIIRKLIKYKNFKLAYEISKFLEYETKKVFHKYVISIMKKEIDNIEIIFGKPLKSKSKEIEEENEKYERLFNNLEKVPGISYIKLAKKASKLGGEKLAMHLIEQEKSALIKIPQLLQLKDQKLEEAIHIAFETYNFNAVIKVLYKIIKDGKLSLLTHNNLQKYFPKILLYLKKYDKENVKGFLVETKNNSQIFYLEFNKYFKENTSDGRNAKIDNCKSLHKKIDNDSNFDNKFVKKYLEKMKYSIEFKKECQKPERNIIHYSELEPYSVSIYDCYKNGIMKEKANWVESENKTFDYSNKKFNLLKLRSYLELKRPDAIERQLEKTSLKKLGLNPMHLAEMFFDYKYYDKATEYLMEVKEPFYFSYVVDILKNMNKFKEALEVIIAAKEIEGKEIMVNEILRKEPKLQKYVDEFCYKYKVSLQQ